jgi:hypothetical protein
MAVHGSTVEATWSELYMTEVARARINRGAGRP